MRFNGSGYYDETPHKAYMNMRKDRAVMARKVVKTVQNVAHLAGFEIVGRVTLRDTDTGEEFR